MKKNRLIHLLLIFPMILFVQSKAVTGTVIDENKMPLPRVSILIKGLLFGYCFQKCFQIIYAA